MEETLKLILEKLQKIDKIESDISSLKSYADTLQNDNRLIHKKLEKLDRIESDISSLKYDNKTTHQKLDMLIDEVANIKVCITDHDIKIEKINSKIRAY